MQAHQPTDVLRRGTAQGQQVVTALQGGYDAAVRVVGGNLHDLVQRSEELHVRHAHVGHQGDIGAGEVIGEIAMFDPAPASATVTTTEPTEVLVLAHRRFESVVRNNPDLAVALLRTLARRFHATQAATATHTHE